MRNTNRRRVGKGAGTAPCPPRTLHRFDADGGHASLRGALPTLQLVASLVLFAVTPAAAQDLIKVGMSMPMTGAGFNAVGRQVVAGARLYLQQHGNLVAGKRIELIV